MKHGDLTSFQMAFKRAWLRFPHQEILLRGGAAFVALLTLTAGVWVADWISALLPLLLGVIASAMTQTDGHWVNQLRKQLMVLVLFTGLTCLIWFILPWPVWLVLLLAGSAFGLTLLTALGERYRTVAFGSLVLMIYCALSAGDVGRSRAQFTIPLMLAGAAWYSCISVLFSAWAPQSEVRHRLARVYETLADYLRLKAALFEPVRELDLSDKKRALIEQNGRIVDALNAVKDSLLVRMGRTNADWLLIAMRRYLAAQDIHERACSSHESYDALIETFFHSDVLFRCQRVLITLGQEAAGDAKRVLTGTPQPDSQAAQAIEDLRASIDHLKSVLLKGKKAQTSAENHQTLLDSFHILEALFRNLTEIHKVLAHARSEHVIDVDRSMVDKEPSSLGDAWRRIRFHLRLSSPLFRHGCRLSFSLVLGFIVMQLSQDSHGYWILLTIVFVSQQHYGATLTKLTQRVLGTFAGLGLGWGLIHLFPQIWVQSVLLVIAGTAFLGLRQRRYFGATVAVTTLLIISFHQMGMSQGVIPVRFVDTLIGALIAGLSAGLVLPNWQARYWKFLVADLLGKQAHYLQTIVVQYQLGKEDHLNYRAVRRDVHDADAALSSAYLAMLKEPSGVRLNVSACGNVVLYSHTMLNYLSALAAHRDQSVAVEKRAQFVQMTQELSSRLKEIAPQAHQTELNFSKASIDSNLNWMGKDPIADTNWLWPLTRALNLIPKLKASISSSL